MRFKWLGHGNLGGNGKLFGPNAWHEADENFVQLQVEKFGELIEVEEAAVEAQEVEEPKPVRKSSRKKKAEVVEE